jgi:HK97 family phage prohead protease
LKTVCSAAYIRAKKLQGENVDKIFKLFRGEIKGVDEASYTLEAVVSTKKTDRDGDVILPEAFKNRLKTYKQHPVLLSSHNYWALTSQIGKAEAITIEDDSVTVRFKYFVGEGNPEADWAWVLGKKGIASFSIGFLTHAFEWIEEKQEDGSMRTVGRKFTDIELLEISQVLVPSNRGALQLSVDMANEEKELAELTMKSIKAGEIKEMAVPEKKAAPAQASHYSESLLVEGKETSTPATKEEVLKVVSQAIEEVFTPKKGETKC